NGNLSTSTRTVYVFGGGVCTSTKTVGAPISCSGSFIAPPRTSRRLRRYRERPVPSSSVYPAGEESFPEHPSEGSATPEGAGCIQGSLLHSKPHLQRWCAPQQHPSLLVAICRRDGSNRDTKGIENACCLHHSRVRLPMARRDRVRHRRARPRCPDSAFRASH